MSPDNVDISVIITAYNVERYITRAIESALMQKGPSIEVIVVDDCSTDGTWAAITDITDARVKSVRLPRNGGPSVARNVAIAQATGTWVAILDGDDAFKPERLARCLERAKEIRADIVVDNLMVIPESGGTHFSMFRSALFEKKGTLGLTEFIKGNRSFMGGYALGYLKPMFLASFLRQHQLSYDTSIRIGEDYLILAEALASGAICAIEPTVGYLYTVRAGSISHRLTSVDVSRISTCDQKFLSRHKLTSEAQKAQKMREFRIKEAYAFTLLVDAIKKKNINGVYGALSSCPTAARYLWLPVSARLKKLFSAEYRKGWRNEAV